MSDGFFPCVVVINVMLTKHALKSQAPTVRGQWSVQTPFSLELGHVHLSLGLNCSGVTAAVTTTATKTQCVPKCSQLNNSQIMIKTK